MASDGKDAPSGDVWNAFTDVAENHYDAGERELAKVEPAWAKAALFFRTAQRFGHSDRNQRCRSLIEMRDVLDVYRRRFERGNTLSLLHAVAICAEENLPLPTWLALAFGKVFDSFNHAGGANSLDAVFHSPSLPTATPKKAAAARQDWQLGVELWDRVWQEVIADEALSSLDVAVDLVLTKQNYGVGKTKARALVLMIERNQRELLRDPPSKHISRFLSKRRKR